MAGALEFGVAGACNGVMTSSTVPVLPVAAFVVDDSACEVDDLAFCGGPPETSSACMICAHGAGRQRHLTRLRAFFAAVSPVVLAPSRLALDFWKSRHLIDGSMAGDIAIGFVTAFVVAILVVRWFLGYITRHGFALFGWWRIGVGALALLALAAGY